MQRLRIVVTPEDYHLGQPNLMGRCAVALAVKRATGHGLVCVDYDHIYTRQHPTEGTEHEYMTPHCVAEMMRAYDQLGMAPDERRRLSPDFEPLAVDIEPAQGGALIPYRGDS